MKKDDNGNLFVSNIDFNDDFSINSFQELARIHDGIGVVKISDAQINLFLSYLVHTGYFVKTPDGIRVANQEIL